MTDYLLDNEGMGRKKKSWNIEMPKFKNVESNGTDNPVPINDEIESSSNSKTTKLQKSLSDQHAAINSKHKDSQSSNVEEYTTYQNSEPGQFNNKKPNEIESQTPEENQTKRYKLYKGLFFSSLSSVFFSLSSVIVKYIDELHPGQLATLRFVGILVFTMPVVTYSKEPVFGPKKVRHFLIIRGLVGATSLFLRFLAFRYLPIADASVIVFSIPVFVAVFARIFLKEPCGIFHAIAIFLTLLGIFLITKMPLVIASRMAYTTDQLWGVIAAVGSTFFGASVYVVIRRIKYLHHSVIMFNFGWVAVIETLILTASIGYFSLPKCGLNQWLVILLGIFSFCGQTLLTLALQCEHAAPVSIVRAAVDIVLAFFWQILFFHEIPDAYSISGALLVSFCVVMISFRKWIVSLPEESTIRKKLFFLTL
ncbi:solute carrier family 35 member G1-like isoform X1 [Centruroides sculpturatus]|uniref:solute carrier family 35 member G1-like isoform X1 n=2 Tax=Centruroides sculpturatus TaxID=218467 RepID=UPI000C6C8B68|nr:solute carrier family 35 member G1-like isoform X1 [Centruroides sculpturatus]